MKPVIAVLWILSIAAAVGLTRLAGPHRSDSATKPSLDEAFAEYDPLRRAYLISASLQDFGPDDLPELHRVIEERRMGIVPEEVRLFMLAWARFDGPAAYEWAMAGPAGWRKTLVEQAIYAWGYYDGPAALAAVEALEESKFKAELKQQALEGWMRSEDKQGVSDYIANLENGRIRGRFYFLLGGEIAMRQGEEGAMRWVEALPDDAPNKMKPALFNIVAKIVAQRDPERAAEWFLAHRTQPYSEGALEGIARRWVQHHDRPAAFAWLLSLNAEDLREGERADAIGGAFRAWMQSDQEAAQEWLLGQLPNPLLDPAVLEALKHVLPADPGRSMEWAQRLNDEKARNRELMRVGVRWRAKEPEVFAAWLTENELPKGIREKILAAPIQKKPNIRMMLQPNPPPKLESPSEP